MHCLWKVYKAGGFHHYPPASVSQDCLCLHPISLTCSSLSFSSLLLLSSILYLCYPLCQLSSLLISLSLSACFSLSLCALWSCLPRLKHCLQSWNITLLCSLFLILQTETLSAELKHYSQSWNITLFGSLVFGAELPWHWPSGFRNSYTRSWLFLSFHIWIVQKPMYSYC